MSDRTCPLNKRACHCDASAADKKNHPCAILKRIGKLFRMFGSSYESEADTARTLMRRTLETEGVSFNDIAILIENCDGEIEERKHSDADLMIIFERGKERGREEAASQPALISDFIDVNGKPQLAPMLDYLDSNRSRLNQKEQELIDEWQMRLRHFRTPSIATAGYILSIFYKTRGSLI